MTNREDSESESFHQVDDETSLVGDDDEDDDDDDENLKNYMNEMDQELKGESKLERVGGETSNDDLDIDLNLVSNAIESYSNQLSLSGPISNIFKSLGL